MDKAEVAFIAATVVQQINTGVMIPVVNALEDTGYTEEDITLIIREIKRQSHLLFEFLDTDMTQKEFIDQLGSGL